jgi:hypothetical protein
MAMKTTKRLCLTLIACTFAGGFAAVFTRPLPTPLPVTIAYYCQPDFRPCFVPAPAVAGLMP